ncbi:MAG: SpoIIE family protein phosphatase [Candidatus Hydrogenedentes bacterium]|nr:SpoIIE family protein phosphatase [Candidatus Hydrogenedentota bacterium]
MLRGYLVCKKNGEPERRVPIGSSITLGRSMECGCVVDDAAASRRHVRITLDGSRFLWKDLGSTNGTQLNGMPMVEGVLAPGDNLQIGETVMRFEADDVPDDPEEPDNTTVFKETIFNWQKAGDEEDREERAESLLRAVFTVMNEISSNYEPCPLVDHILETTMRAIDAQRGAIVFASAEVRELQPCPVCRKFHVIVRGKVQHVGHRDFTISETVAQRVIKRGESLLYQDTDRDSELNVSESIRSLRLRSIICAPLRGKFGIFGILYVDSDSPKHQYTHEDMLLSTAVGNSAGLALENARMHSQIVDKERMDQEIQHAWQIQQGFLINQWPDGDKRFQVYGDMRPAKTVGGDFYDFVQPDESRIGILVGDVSGKGVPAALTMAQLLAEFRLAARERGTPSEIFQTLNKSMSMRGTRGTFCTLSYLILELDSGRVLCASAGHHPAIAVGKGDLRVFGNATGPPIGILPESAWTNTESRVKPGETLLLYTDGIVEARTAHTRAEGSHGPDEYGMENLTRVAATLYGSDPRAMIEAINADVRKYCAPAAPHDDCTMVAVKYLG